MKVAFISYWGINQGLTRSTVFPHLDFLVNNDAVEQVYFFSIEREEISELPELHKKIRHYPVYEKKTSLPGMEKFTTLREIYKRLIDLGPELVFARSSLAGIPAYFYYKKTKTPYVVESFEPHASYMIDAGEWQKNGMKNKLLTYYESQQKKTAHYLLPVSNNYAEVLRSEGVEEERIDVLPCTVDTEKFYVNTDSRSEIRNLLGIDNDTVLGVYVGKFGGIYQEEEAFKNMQNGLQQFAAYSLLVLTPHPEKEVFDLAAKANFSKDLLSVVSVPFEEVPKYLSAADIAFATYKQMSSNQYLSPIKVGEYQACELFTVITDGVGDDADLMEQEGVGLKLSHIDQLRSAYANYRKENSLLYVQKYRSRKLMKEIYGKILSNTQI